MKNHEKCHKVSQLRKLMNDNKTDMLIIPSSDAHFSEYTPCYARCREYISGFSGSAGTLLINRKEALLWTDSRYWLQAEKQLDSSIFSLMKEGEESTPSIDKYISTYKGKTVAIDGNLISVAQFEKMSTLIGDNKLTVCGDMFDNLWENRPPMPVSEAFLIDNAGEDVVLKLQRVKKALNMKEDSVYIVTALDEIAWLLNMRGADIEYNPLNIAYLIIERRKATLYSLTDKYNSEIINILSSLGVEIKEYNLFAEDIKAMEGKTIIYNPDKLNFTIYNNIDKSKNSIKTEEDPNGIITSLKAIKNKKEIEGFRKAMIEDGVALTQLYMWIEECLTSGIKISETDISEKLHSLRSQNPLYYSDSFATIVGFAENGAIVHYNPQRGADKFIDKDGFLLIDAGAHYLCGTTDITRTIYIGTPEEEHILDYTLVLQGHIDLATARFPKGTRGSQLDILARTPLFRNGLNYLHGTGHGIGFFLNVHEGPQSIRANENPVAFYPGMVTSNEPAVYKTGKYGIRIENVTLCGVSTISELGDFYKFNTITLFPIDTKCVDKKILTYTQLTWLNNYNNRVLETLKDSLTGAEKEWLKSKCKPL